MKPETDSTSKDFQLGQNMKTGTYLIPEDKVPVYPDEAERRKELARNACVLYAASIPAIIDARLEEDELRKYVQQSVEMAAEIMRLAELHREDESVIK